MSAQTTACTAPFPASARRAYPRAGVRRRAGASIITVWLQKGQRMTFYTGKDHTSLSGHDIAVDVAHLLTPCIRGGTMTGTWPIELERRDRQLCACGHRNISHAYGPAGIGSGACGFCPCDSFEGGEQVKNPEICPSCNRIIRPTGECGCSD